MVKILVKYRTDEEYQRFINCLNKEYTILSMTIPRKGEYYIRREVFMDEKKNPTKLGRLEPLKD
jgi:hypothetical protein